jgi:signal transduction histidine kinase
MHAMDHLITGVESPLEEIRTRVAALPSIWRRRAADTSLSTLPGGIRLALLTSPYIVRWGSWSVALLIVALADLDHNNNRFEPWLLIGTAFQLLAVTFYLPVLRPSALDWLRRYTPDPERIDVLGVGLVDLVLSVIVLYLSGGWGSPYYHFALTALLIPSFFLTFRGVCILGGAYMLAYLFGLMSFGDGLNGSWKDTNLNSFIGAMVTPLLVALVPNYLGNLLRELDAARSDAVDALADSDLQFRVARAFLEGGRELEDVLPHVAATALEASRFDRVILLVIDTASPPSSDRARDDRLPASVASAPRQVVRGFGMTADAIPEASSLFESFGRGGAGTYPVSSMPPPLDTDLRDYGWAAAVPLRSGRDVEGWLVAAMRERPASIFHEVRLLDAVAGQIALGIRNVRLTAQVGELAAEGERTRIAREIHDGIAQLMYMLSLSLETAVDRVGGDADEQRQRLRDLTALAKTALWEVRQYIFDLRPLLSGDEGFVGAVQGQVKEFQAVSELPVDLRVRGEPVRLPVETSASLYRIVQEGLGNIFRHAKATHVRLDVSFAPDGLRLAIEDNGIGIEEPARDGRVGFGMGNLRRRVDDLGGKLSVRSAPGEGTRIEVAVPIGGEE